MLFLSWLQGTLVPSIDEYWQCCHSGDLLECVCSEMPARPKSSFIRRRWTKGYEIRPVDFVDALFVGFVLVLACWIDVCTYQPF